MDGPALPPPAVIMQMMTAAWISQTISAVTRLDVPDLLEKHGATTARVLVETHGVNARPELLHRALRACASVGVFTEDAGGRFGPTPLSAVLTAEGATSMRDFVDLIGGRWWGLIGGLSDTLHAGQQPPRAFPEPPDAAATERFGRAMRSRRQSTQLVLEHGDFAQARSLVDVGGGFGHLAMALLARYPALRATVLDLPHVVTAAARHAAGEDPDVLARLSFVGGDMFREVPSADTYVLRAIVHDWDDASVLRVLDHCRAGLAAGGRVISVDNVLPPLGDTGCSSTKFLDMLMMVSLPGQERTEAEWRSLYGRANLRVTSIRVINPRSGESLIEGVAAEG